MSPMETSNPQERPNMEAFRAEISSLIASKSRIELENVKVEELTEADAVMWKKINNYKKGLITEDELKEYRNNINNNSSKALCLIIAGKIDVLWGKEELGAQWTD